MTALRDWMRPLVDVVFPRICVHCGELPEGGALRHLCPRCERQLRKVESPHCTTCGHPFWGDMEGDRLCPHCVGLTPEFSEGRTAFVFQGPARALVHALKYNRGLHVLEDVEQLIRAHPHVLEFIRGATLVPVPLHPRKERERGYNQCRLLAETFAKASDGSASVCDWLRRVRDTQTQTHLDREQRRANLKNAFALAPEAVITHEHSIILIDDVFTTGSTLNACAAVLRRAGCLKLGVLTLGHG